MSTITTASGHEVQIATGDATEAATNDGFTSFGSRPRGVTEAQIRDLVAYLMDPESPVNK